MSEPTPTRRAVAAALAALPLAACAGRVDPGDGFAADSTDAVILAQITVRGISADRRHGGFELYIRTTEPITQGAALRQDDPSRTLHNPDAPRHGEGPLSYPGAEESLTLNRAAGALGAGVVLGAALAATAGTPSRAPGLTTTRGQSRFPARKNAADLLQAGLVRLRALPAGSYDIAGAGLWLAPDRLFNAYGDYVTRTGIFSLDLTHGPPNAFVDMAGQPLRFTAAPRTVSYLGDFELTVVGDRLLLTGYGHDRAAAEAHLRAHAPKMLDALTIVDLKPALAPRP